MQLMTLNMLKKQKSLKSDVSNFLFLSKIGYWSLYLTFKGNASNII